VPAGGAAGADEALDAGAKAWGPGVAAAEADPAAAGAVAAPPPPMEVALPDPEPASSPPDAPGRIDEPPDSGLPEDALVDPTRSSRTWPKPEEVRAGVGASVGVRVACERPSCRSEEADPSDPLEPAWEPCPDVSWLGVTEGSRLGAGPWLATKRDARAAASAAACFTVASVPRGALLADSLAAFADES
jgi:hypothetical protein